MSTKNEKDLGDLGAEFFGDFTKKLLGESLPIKDVLGLSKTQINDFYHKAYHLYNNGKYDEAINLFRALILYDDSEPKYYIGLAACCHLMKRYKEAAKIYTFAAILDPDNPIPHYHYADCCIQLKDLFAAMIGLEMAIKRAEGKKEFSEVKHRAQLALEGLKNQTSDARKG